MQENIERTEAINIRAAVWDATVRDPESVKKADIVLADVPCSGLGVIGQKQDLKYKMSEKRQQDIIRLQRRILSVVQEYLTVSSVRMYRNTALEQSYLSHLLEIPIYEDTSLPLGYKLPLLLYPM